MEEHTISAPAPSVIRDHTKPLPWVEAIPVDENDPAVRRKAIILSHLWANGVANVTASFDGSGDSGQLEDPILWGVDGESVEIHDIVLMLSSEAVPVGEELRDFLTDLLDECQVDWYNNDGGWGDFNIDIYSGEVTLDMNVRVTSSENYKFAY